VFAHEDAPVTVLLGPMRLLEPGATVQADVFDHDGVGVQAYFRQIEPPGLRLCECDEAAPVSLSLKARIHRNLVEKQMILLRYQDQDAHDRGPVAQHVYDTGGRRPAFAFHLDVRVEVPGIGTLTVDIAYGGMIYVIAEAEAAGFRLTPDEGRDITRVGAMLIAAAGAQYPVVHPENDQITGPTIAQFSGPPTRPDAARKNAVVVPTRPIALDRPASWTGSIDRSPCGTGSCA
jgi:Proline racemase